MRSGVALSVNPYGYLPNRSCSPIPKPPIEGTWYCCVVHSEMFQYPSTKANDWSCWTCLQTAAADEESSTLYLCCFSTMSRPLTGSRPSLCQASTSATAGPPSAAGPLSQRGHAAPNVDVS